ncbi:membrane-associated protein, putative [Bodo saltans]|uniref:Membrane-associated protein, putative n=1 Tax=Bodo saltans TaxID=75058 RepID=A0A0S4JQF1_BODSA|nr:membrane-associated protein, putative [Bodo saltans]|eukprot:CUG92758.1 membrane-associated protein, putative [Bodo saltans]
MFAHVYSAILTILLASCHVAIALTGTNGGCVVEACPSGWSCNARLLSDVSSGQYYWSGCHTTFNHLPGGACNTACVNGNNGDCSACLATNAEFQWWDYNCSVAPLPCIEFTTAGAISLRGTSQGQLLDGTYYALATYGQAVADVSDNAAVDVATIQSTGDFTVSTGQVNQILVAGPGTRVNINSQVGLINATMYDPLITIAYGASVTEIYSTGAPTVVCNGFISVFWQIGGVVSISGDSIVMNNFVQQGGTSYFTGDIVIYNVMQQVKGVALFLASGTIVSYELYAGGNATFGSSSSTVLYVTEFTLYGGSATFDSGAYIDKVSITGIPSSLIVSATVEALYIQTSGAFITVTDAGYVETVTNLGYVATVNVYDMIQSLVAAAGSVTTVLCDCVIVNFRQTQASFTVQGGIIETASGTGNFTINSSCIVNNLTPLDGGANIVNVVRVNSDAIVQALTGVGTFVISGTVFSIIVTASSLQTTTISLTGAGRVTSITANNTRGTTISIGAHATATTITSATFGPTTTIDGTVLQSTSTNSSLEIYVRSGGALHSHCQYGGALVLHNSGGIVGNVCGYGTFTFFDGPVNTLNTTTNTAGVTTATVIVVNSGASITTVALNCSSTTLVVSGGYVGRIELLSAVSSLLIVVNGSNNGGFGELVASPSCSVNNLTIVSSVSSTDSSTSVGALHIGGNASIWCYGVAYQSSTKPFLTIAGPTAASSPSSISIVSLYLEAGSTYHVTNVPFVLVAANVRNFTVVWRSSTIVVVDCSSVFHLDHVSVGLLDLRLINMAVNVTNSTLFLADGDNVSIGSLSTTSLVQMTNVNLMRSIGTTTTTTHPGFISVYGSSTNVFVNVSYCSYELLLSPTTTVSQSSLMGLYSRSSLNSAVFVSGTATRVIQNADQEGSVSTQVNHSFILIEVNATQESSGTITGVAVNSRIVVSNAAISSPQASTVTTVLRCARRTSLQNASISLVNLHTAQAMTFVRFDEDSALLNSNVLIEGASLSSLHSSLISIQGNVSHSNLTVVCVVVQLAWSNFVVLSSVATVVAVELHSVAIYNSGALLSLVVISHELSSSNSLRLVHSSVRVPVLVATGSSGSAAAFSGIAVACSTLGVRKNGQWLGALSFALALRPLVVIGAVCQRDPPSCWTTLSQTASLSWDSFSAVTSRTSTLTPALTLSVTSTPSSSRSLLNTLSFSQHQSASQSQSAVQVSGTPSVTQYVTVSTSFTPPIASRSASISWHLSASASNMTRPASHTLSVTAYRTVSPSLTAELGSTTLSMTLYRTTSPSSTAPIASESASPTSYESASSSNTLLQASGTRSSTITYDSTPTSTLGSTRTFSLSAVASLTQSSSRSEDTQPHSTTHTNQFTQSTTFCTTPSDSSTPTFQQALTPSSSSSLAVTMSHSLSLTPMRMSGSFTQQLTATSAHSLSNSLGGASWSPTNGRTSTLSPTEAETLSSTVSLSMLPSSTLTNAHTWLSFSLSVSFSRSKTKTSTSSPTLTGTLLPTLSPSMTPSATRSYEATMSFSSSVSLSSTHTTTTTSSPTQTVTLSPTDTASIQTASQSSATVLVSLSETPKYCWCIGNVNTFRNVVLIDVKATNGSANVTNVTSTALQLAPYVANLSEPVVGVVPNSYVTTVTVTRLSAWAHGVLVLSVAILSHGATQPLALNTSIETLCWRPAAVFLRGSAVPVIASIRLPPPPSTDTVSWFLLIGWIDTNTAPVWVPNTIGPYVDITLSFDVVFRCDAGDPAQDGGAVPFNQTVELSVPVAGLAQPLSAELRASATTSQIIAAMVSTGGGAVAGRVLVTRAMVLCSSGPSAAMAAGGPLGLEVMYPGCDKDAATPIYRGTIVGNMILISVVCFAVIVFASLLRYHHHQRSGRWSIAAACRQVAFPSCLQSVWSVVLPSTSTATFQLIAVGSDGCAGDILCILAGCVVVLAPTLALVALCVRMTPAILTHVESHRGKGPLALFTNILHPKWVWVLIEERRDGKNAVVDGNHQLITQERIPKDHYLRYAVAILREYTVIQYALMDAVMLIVVGILVAVSGHGGAAQCQTAAILAAVCFAAQLIVCATTRPFTTSFSLGCNLFTLFMTLISAILQLLTFVIPADNAHVGSLADLGLATSVCDLVIIGVSYLRSALDGYEFIVFLIAVARKRRARRVGQSASALNSSGMTPHLPVVDTDDPFELNVTLAAAANDDAFIDRKEVAMIELQFWDDQGYALPPSGAATSATSSNSDKKHEEETHEMTLSFFANDDPSLYWELLGLTDESVLRSPRSEFKYNSHDPMI